MGLFNRVIDRLRAASSTEDPFGEAPSPETGITPIAETGDRRRATVRGRVQTLSLPDNGTAMTLDVELADRTGSLHLRFLGRTAIPGIECGVVLRAEGLVSTQGSRRVMYNPVYEIVPRRDH